MKKINAWKLLLVMVLVLSMCLPFVACKQNGTEEPTQSATTTTEPSVTVETTEPDTTQNVTEEPVDDEPVIIQAGTISKHMKGKNGDLGIYFSMAPNDIPFDSSWATEYKPGSKSTIQLFRDGQTYDIGRTAGGMVVKYGATDYYLKLEEWLLREYFPIRNGDIIKINGIFKNNANGVYFQIDTSYIQISEGLVFYSTEYPTGSGVRVKYVGNPTSHPNGKTANGIYFSLPKNSVPYKKDWSVEYTPASESVIKLIRDGKTYNIGNKAAGTIVKYGETDYYLKTEKWIIKDFYPIRDGDIIVLNGKFSNSGVSTVFSISKTYISINDGLLSFSEEYPSGNTVEAVQIPTMLDHPNGFSGTGVYFKAEENSLPFNTDWSLEYFPKEAGAVKLIRDGQTYDIGNVNAGTIVKYKETDYYFKLDSWMYGSYAPFGDGDILIVEGKFVNAGVGALMQIGKTYISINSGMAYLSTEYPTGPVGPTEIAGGTMSAHENGWNADANGGLWFKLDANEAPFNSDWSLRYTPTTNATVKLIRAGVTYDVANTGAEMLVKYGETNYYLEFWPISQKPIVEGDILVVEGKFVNAANNVVITIDKTYITIENGQPVFSNDLQMIIEAGSMQPHGNGWNTGGNNGLYFTMADNIIPFDGWSVEYEPVSAAAIKLIRGGETYNIGMPSRGTIVKFGATDYYLKLETWTIGDYAPIVPGDVLMIEGKFTNYENGTTFAISKSVIAVGEDYTLSFTEGEATDNVIQAGTLNSHEKGWNADNRGMYFTMVANALPMDADGNAYYIPTVSNNIQLIRNGQTIDLAQTDREYIIKYNESDYYLRLDAWTIGDAYPIVPGDVLVVGGLFDNRVFGVEFNVTTTYITVGDNYVLIFSEEAPEIEGQPTEPDVSETDGPLLPHREHGLKISGAEHLIYAAMAENDGIHSGWETEYTVTDPAGLKLIRNGVTYDVGNPGQGILVKYSATDYCLKLAPWTATGNHLPLVAGDQIIVEGEYIGRAGTPCEGSSIWIEKTTITYNADGSLTFSSATTEPEVTEPETTVPDVSEPETIEPDNHGPMAAHSVNGWTATGGLYFTMSANDVPYDSWNIRYKPTSESNVQLVRNGVTYHVAHTQRETIVKYSDTEYYFEFWTLDTYKPVLAGDVMIIEGAFVNAANGATLNIAKTTITFNADGTATFVSDTAEPELPDDPGTEPESVALPLKAWDEKGWNTNSNGGFWFTMDSNDIPADDTWVLEYTPVSADALKLVRNGQTVNIGYPGRGTIVKATEAEYYLKLEWNIGEYANTITIGDQVIVEGDFTNATNGYTFTVKKTVITIGENYVLTFQTDDDIIEEPGEEDTDVLQVGTMMANSSGITDAIIYFTLADNDIPASLIKSDFRPAEAGTIKLIRDGQTYDIANPDVKTVVKQTAAGKYRLLRSSLTMELQAGDILVVEGIFTGGNTDSETVFTISIAKSYIFIGDGEVTFSTELPAEK